MINRTNLKLWTVILVCCVVGIGIFLGCQPIREQRDCVVMLGDSIFALTGAEPAALQRIAGQQYRHYYVSGAQLSGGSVIAPGDIEDQLERAINLGSIRTIIMDGGGNDFLLGLTFDAAVEAELKAAWGRILDKAANAGVQTIIFQGYYPTTSATAFQLRVNDEIVSWLPAQAASRGIDLYPYNPNADSWFTSQRPMAYTLIDGIHPTTAASEHMAQMLWNLMVQHGVEQGEGCPSSNGCN